MGEVFALFMIYLSIGAIVFFINDEQHGDSGLAFARAIAWPLLLIATIIRALKTAWKEVVDAFRS